MSLEAQPEFLAEELVRWGALRGKACFNCGNCSAICPLAETNPFYPRQVIRYTQLGATKKILGSPAIWLCYHCGECTTMCPRQADPGEVVMSLRRWAIAQYDWTGLGKILYRSPWLSLVFYLAAAALAGLVFYFFHGPLDMEKVRLHLFLPTHLIDVCGLSLGALVLFTLGINLYRMNSWYRSEYGSLPLDVRELLRTFWEEVVIQRRYQKCEDKSKWMMHASMVNGFLLLFLTTALAFLLNPEGDPEKLPLAVRLLGTVGGFSLVFGALVANWRRFTGKEVYNHFTDWIFLELVLLAGLTGLALELLVALNLPMASYLLYALHLIVVFLLILTAPYSKFAHALYRFLAVYAFRLEKREQATSEVAKVS
ncbi:4Fe-4S dicluster domain-containing protein [Ammonifex thiophilus]|uniref:4Fe-4S dicluster domain-containing protein n=1 Tax=Ammonifex thiophilus TaxID=444093 RepID=A0A3D8P5Q9_9THEO|nr:4Fe-4S dicluster domain-containing protein [Ammonifex thiophilus]RDV83642.1 4Fe-4S dicluster domain-containing protein [Ammonifex thiophilus]